MPSVVDKASQLSLQRSRNALKPRRYFPGKDRLSKFYHQFNFTTLIQARRLVIQRPDMPRQASEEQVFVTRNKRSSASPELTENCHSRSVTPPSLDTRMKHILILLLEPFKWSIT